MNKATLIASIGLFVAMSVSPVHADIILEFDLTDPGAGYSIIDVSGGAISPVLGGGNLIFDNFFTPGDGGASSTLTGGDLRDTFFGSVVGGNGLIGSGSQLLVEATAPTHQFFTNLSMFTGDTTNTYSPGLVGTFPAINMTGDILLSDTGVVLGQWRAVSSAVPEPSSAMMICAMAGCLFWRFRICSGDSESGSANTPPRPSRAI